MDWEKLTDFVLDDLKALISRQPQKQHGGRDGRNAVWRNQQGHGRVAVAWGGVRKSGWGARQAEGDQQQAQALRNKAEHPGKSGYLIWISGSRRNWSSRRSSCATSCRTSLTWTATRRTSKTTRRSSLSGRRNWSMNYALSYSTTTSKPTSRMSSEKAPSLWSSKKKSAPTKFRSRISKTYSRKRWRKWPRRPRNSTSKSPNSSSASTKLKSRTSSTSSTYSARSRASSRVKTVSTYAKKLSSPKALRTSPNNSQLKTRSTLLSQLTSNWSKRSSDA